jgi:hypothetical protein
MRFIKLVAAVGLGLLSVQLGSGVPLLQLDIAGAYYDSASQTIIANNNPFTLYALFHDEGNTAATPAGTYYVSAAIIPKTENPPVASFGSFTVDGTAYSVGNMTYGTPPVDALLNRDDLPSHGIYDTHYAEIGFTFNLGDNATPYNAQDTPGGLVEPSSGSLYYHAFTIDISGIAAGYNVHFDLYSTTVDPKTGKVTVDKFAPFSHDAQGGTRVPDSSSTLILFGMAILAFEGFRRRFARS